MLSVENLTVTYGAGAVAVDDLSLTVGDGECVALVGANGAGKSTTLRAITGLEETSSGRIVVGDQDITGWSTHRIIEQGLVMVPEGRQLFPHLSVADNLVLGAFSHRRRGSAHMSRKTEEILEIFPDLRTRMRSSAGSLSGGQQQMVAIGRALMGEPWLLVLDEPSLGLAPMICETIFGVVERLHGEGMSVLVVEQNVRLSLKISDRAYVLERGRMVVSGRSADLIDDPAMRDHFLGSGSKVEAAGGKAHIERLTLGGLLSREPKA